MIIKKPITDPDGVWIEVPMERFRRFTSSAFDTFEAEFSVIGCNVDAGRRVYHLQCTTTADAVRLKLTYA